MIVLGSIHLKSSRLWARANFSICFIAALVTFISFPFLTIQRLYLEMLHCGAKFKNPPFKKDSGLGTSLEQRISAALLFEPIGSKRDYLENKQVPINKCRGAPLWAPQKGG